MNESITGAFVQISITQTSSEPRISVLENDTASFGEVPVFPLTADPSQAWELRIVDGVLTWVLVAEEAILNFNDPAWLVF